MADDEDQQTAAYTFRERGLFWWAHEPMLSQHQAPESAVIGELKITSEGRIRLDLDGMLHRERHEPFHTDSEAEYLALRPRRIFGVLRESGRRVLLLDLWNGPSRHSSYTFSVESFGAAQCLIGDQRFDGTMKEPKFSRIEADLKGFEEWLWSNALKVKRGKTVFTAKYRKPTQVAYRLQSGRLWFLHFLDGSHQTGRHPDLTWSERTYIRYAPSKPFGIEGAIEWHRWLQDLMILLTDSDYCLELPEVKWGKHTCTLYFQRSTSKAERPRRHECAVNFPKLKADFGTVFDTWIAAREKYGSAFYLYLGTRKGVQQYIENQFFMLVSGIESFHRIKHSLPRMHLKDRIVQMITDLSLGLADDRVNKFARDCVKFRNSIAHGGHRSGTGSYSDYITSVQHIAGALAPLYHALLLLEIGLDPQMVRDWVITVPPAFRRRWALAQAGLTEPIKTLDDISFTPEAPSHLAIRNGESALSTTSEELSEFIEVPRHGTIYLRPVRGVAYLYDEARCAQEIVPHILVEPDPERFALIEELLSLLQGIMLREWHSLGPATALAPHHCQPALR